LLFNSFEFLFFFLPITFVIYFYINKKKFTKISKAYLILSSLFFYSWWNIVYLPLILFSMIFNYVLGKSIIKNKENNFLTKKKLLFFGILSNICLLGYFKYADFFINNTNFFFNLN